MDDERIYLTQREYLKITDSRMKLEQKLASNLERLNRYTNPESQQEILQGLFTNRQYVDNVIDHIKRTKGFRALHSYYKDPEKYLKDDFYKRVLPNIEKELKKELSEISENLEYLNRYFTDPPPPPTYQSVYQPLPFTFPQQPQQPEEPEEPEDTGAGIGA